MVDTTSSPPPNPPPRLFRAAPLHNTTAAQPAPEVGEIPKDFDLPFVSLSTQIATLPSLSAPVSAIKSLTVDMSPSTMLTGNASIYNNQALFDSWKRRAEILHLAWQLETVFESKEEYRAMLHQHLAKGVNQGNKT